MPCDWINQRLFFLLVVAAHVPTVLVEQLNARRRNACFLLVLEL